MLVILKDYPARYKDFSFWENLWALPLETEEVGIRMIHMVYIFHFKNEVFRAKAERFSTKAIISFQFKYCFRETIYIWIGMGKLSCQEPSGYL